MLDFLGGKLGIQRQKPVGDAEIKHAAGLQRAFSRFFKIFQICIQINQKLKLQAVVNFLETECLAAGFIVDDFHIPRACRVQQIHAVDFSAEYQAASVCELNYDRRQSVMQTKADFITRRDKRSVLQMPHKCPGRAGGNAFQPPDQIAICRTVQKDFVSKMGRGFVHSLMNQDFRPFLCQICPENAVHFQLLRKTFQHFMEQKPQIRRMELVKLAFFCP